MKLPLKITIKAKKGKPEGKGVTGPHQIPGVVTLWSPLATGKSVLAGSLANAVAQQIPEKKVCLVDFDMYTPAFSSKMDLNKTAEAIFKGDFDPERLAKSIAPVKGFKNLYCLGGLTDILSMDMFNQENIKGLLDAFSERFDHLIIDAGREINLASTLMAFYAAGMVIVPVIGKVGPLRHARRYLDLMENGLNLEKEKIKVVVNKHDKHLNGFSVDEIKELLGRPAVAITYDTKLTGNELITKSIDPGGSEHLLSLLTPLSIDNNKPVKTNTKTGLKRAERADNLGSC